MRKPEEPITDPAELIESLKPLSIAFSVWATERLAERGFGGVQAYLKLYFCFCHEALLMLNRRAEGFEPTPEIIVALREIVSDAPLTFVDDGECPHCGILIPEALEYRSIAAVDATGKVHGFEVQKLAS